MVVGHGGAVYNSRRMSREIVINATRHESRIAVLDEGQAVELWVERTRHRTIVGNIYKGRVTKVLPGMQSAFVDLGLDRDAFLYVSDVIEDLEEYESETPEELHLEDVVPPPRGGGVDLRAPARGAGDRRPGVEGHDRRQGRPHHQPHHAARPLPGLHADGRITSACRGGSRTRRSGAASRRSWSGSVHQGPGGYIVRTAGEGRDEESSWPTSGI